ncbi:MAG TPA: malto-oligosyltrehalose synthase [Mucilaginibacter sp.]|nr:malto-oligosyltrehalose synthase [Mucilaginibacter sp.]
MYNPVSTYRIQFHKGFTFSDLEKIVPYLAKLGIKTIYASPVFKAVPGSMHGYDVTDPLNINPEIGTLRQLRSISKKLRKLGIGWLQDIVPNHMAFHPDNQWLMNVLEYGRDSDYAGVFDIFWDSPVCDGKLMVPFLGKPLDDAIGANEIKLTWSEKPVLDYFGQQYPICSASYAELYTDGADPNAFIEKVNNDPNMLRQLINSQHYQLCYWQETDKQINFRRFFTVNGLICLNMQESEVFNRYHVLIKKLVDEGIFQGLRVDHVDGLYDPKTYLQRLRELAGPDIYIIVEKILEEGEQFPADWPVQGNTGYDFLATMNNLFTCRTNKTTFQEFYRSVDPEQAPVGEQVFQKKRLILDNNMQGELENLRRLFFDLRLDDEIGHIGPEVFKKAIAEILVRCPVYRFYGNTMPLPDDEAAAMEALLRETSKNDPVLSSVNDVLEDCLLLKPKVADEDYRRRALHFYVRLMQFTGPLMAKGVEDTLMYTYNRFVDHNEVGDSPGSFGLKTAGFDRIMQNRQQRWPLSMSASSTHDTKRGEDVRARLNVLSDLADEWIQKAGQWQKLNQHLKTNDAPDLNDEYFIYQTLIGAYPMPGSDKDNFGDRLQAYLEKSLREAKRNSNWTQPNEEYEKAAKKFAARLLDTKGKFWKSFEPFHSRMADFGIVNSLSQTLLKYTCPGVPDLYQGGELWDLSLVDPDNRRPVDYLTRESFLNGNTEWKQLWQERYNGQIKQALTRKLLEIRQTSAVVFEKGEYIPIKVKGRFKENIFGFARHYEGKWFLAVIPLHTAAIAETDNNSVQLDWDDTRVIMPDGAPLSWQNILTGASGYSAKGIDAGQLFSDVPVALLQLKPPANERSAGVLLHITSLPSSFGIGDVGPEAYRFADFLSQSRQKYWQMLPVSPIAGGSGYSPYSATSAMAGNALLISPELLVKEGLLTKDDLKKYAVTSEQVDFKQATAIKKSLFDQAYSFFTNTADRTQFERFKQDEAWWLDDFALYQYLKDRFNDKPWHQWPKQYKFREPGALRDIISEPGIEQIKWLQFVFADQWSALKAYCNKKDIALLGDMPFYISYDSVDVWANPQLFKIDKNGKIKGLAGVPPDYFSKTGQLWGMPVYNWDRLKQNGYDWWFNRIRRNLQFFDLIRLDHFRAFSEYWEVPGGSKTAVGGSWKPGPGKDFFEKLKGELGDLPFVAEDLGQIDEKVYELRDAFNLPGMRVLQFAFDKGMPVSEHIPHNYTFNSFAYTGTHDNNTVKGWFENDIDSKTQKRLRKYAGTKVNAGNISKVMTRMCYESVAKNAIVPLQDLLGLDESARMNTPSSIEGNWAWMMNGAMLSRKLSKYLRNLAIQCNR